jgi:hypothetical protein
MIKLKKEIRLEPGTPIEVIIPNGIDFYDDQIKLDYPILSAKHIIDFSVKSNTGQSLSSPLLLDVSGYMSRLFPDIFKHILDEYTNDVVEDRFASIKLLSNSLFFITVTIESPEGNFF